MTWWKEPCSFSRVVTKDEARTKTHKDTDNFLVITVGEQPVKHSTT
jgi:hypothetical protein